MTILFKRLLYIVLMYGSDASILTIHVLENLIYSIIYSKGKIYYKRRSFSYFCCVPGA